jgi:hypothetical protein
MTDSPTDIFKKRKDKGYYSSLIGRYLMDIEMKFREFFRVLRGIHLESNKGRHNNSKLQSMAGTNFS